MQVVFRHAIINSNGENTGGTEHEALSDPSWRD